MKRIFCIFWLVAMSLTSTYSFSIDWQPVGSGDMRWTFLKLYRIQLETDTGVHQLQTYPQALEITYYRDIPRSRLIEATRDQWAHIKLNNAAQNQWLSQLEQLWPDIKKGDILRFEVDAKKNNRFIYNGVPIGGIDDKAFSIAFLSIWLSTATSEPTLRQQLVTTAN